VSGARRQLGAPAGTFERLPADLAEVRPPLLVPAGDVPQQGPLLREALLAELAAEGTLPGVRPVVLVQARCRPQGERGGAGGQRCPGTSQAAAKAVPARCGWAAPGWLGGLRSGTSSSLPVQANRYGGKVINFFLFCAVRVTEIPGPFLGGSMRSRERGFAPGEAGRRRVWQHGCALQLRDASARCPEGPALPRARGYLAS